MTTVQTLVWSVPYLASYIVVFRNDSLRINPWMGILPRVKSLSVSQVCERTTFLIALIMETNMIRNTVIDMVKVGDTYQILNPDVIALPDLSRERAKQLRSDYIDFGRPIKGAALPRPKYTLQPRSILAAAVHLECKKKDTAFSFALGKAAGYKLMATGTNPNDIISPIYEKYKPKKKNRLDAISTHSKFTPASGWIQQQDGSYIRIHENGQAELSFYSKPPEEPIEHTYDNFIRRYGLGSEDGMYERYVKGEVHCG